MSLKVALVYFVCKYFVFVDPRHAFHHFMCFSGFFWRFWRHDGMKMPWRMPFLTLRRYIWLFIHVGDHVLGFFVQGVWGCAVKRVGMKGGAFPGRAFHLYTHFYMQNSTPFSCFNSQSWGMAAHGTMGFDPFFFPFWRC